MNPITHYAEQALTSYEEVIAELMDALAAMNEMVSSGNKDPRGCLRCPDPSKDGVKVLEARELLTRYAHMRKP